MLRLPIEPMLAAPVDRLPGSHALPGGCAFEPKFDGYRALVHLDEDGRVLIQSRRGAVITDSFPDIAGAAAEQLPSGTVIDGELVVLGQSGVLEFEALQRRLGAGAQLARRLALAQPASFVAFDLLAHHGSDHRSKPFRSRRRLLERLMGDCRPPLQLTPQTTDVDVARRWVEQYATAAVGLEGVVAKGLDQSYEPGRRGWLKYRVRNTHEVILGAVTGNLTAPGRLVLGMMSPAGELEPLVVEVSADQSFEHGKWRHIVRFVRPRPDLTIEEAPSTP